jgi:hypothetical protein
VTTRYEPDEYDQYFAPEAEPAPPEPGPVTVRNASPNPLIFTAGPGERALQIDPDCVAQIPAHHLDNAAVQRWISTGTLEIVEAEGN